MENIPLKMERNEDGGRPTKKLFSNVTRKESYTSEQGQGSHEQGGKDRGN